ncbi:uncharacterized protein LOC119085174 isoform X1 [Bradysia coprophila]|uniref:uncharacterized protein LOC119085174 isoform X1 n=1 Tax=Bradysia coprophila TaxID=38358 RepID=UPI00187DB89B|nr:uncharacterized protein LOC119085174 isoform X1 [Bradysia coprophila]
MVQFKLTIVALIIGVLQVCTANPISTEEESDVTKLFSADELQLANDARLPIPRLVEGKLDFGLTFEEMIKLHNLRNSMKAPKTAFPEDMYGYCQILVPDLKMPASFTSAQEAHFPNLIAVTNRLQDRRDHISYIRASVCSYLGQPDKFDTEANSFGLPLVPYMQMRFMTMKAEKAKGTDRVKVVKQMCCLNKHRDEAVMLDKSAFTGLPDGEMKDFDEHWNQYETANTLKSFENICELLYTKDQANIECVVAMPIPTNA